jgi:Xaa-Pro aminopeptidase
VNDLELRGARARSRAGTVLPISRYADRLRARGIAFPGLYQALAEALRERGVRRADVPGSFPAAALACLSRAGIRARIVSDPFLPGRAMKTPEEVKRIREAIRAAEAGLATAVLNLAASRIGRDGYLHLRGRPLTSEHLREIAERAMFAAGAVPAHTIVAGGVQGSDPHERGTGPLPAHRPIVLDFFPRSRTSGYHGDVTRTVVKGRADSRTRTAFLAVATACEMALGMVRDGADAAAIHRKVAEFFREAGFPPRRRGPVREGFIHGTGHGLGLELHEDPPISSRPGVLRAGHVITVEPGLYYRDMGGIRIEDVVLVTRRGSRRLTRFPVFLEIP